jgi:hypothetical protein
VLDEAVITSCQLNFLLHRLTIKPHHGINVARFAEQFPKLRRWRELLRYICARITASPHLRRCNGDRSLKSQEDNCGFQADGSPERRLTLKQFASLDARL